MTEQSISPLCQRMIETTSVRGLGHTKFHTEPVPDLIRGRAIGGSPAIRCGRSRARWSI